MVISRCRLLGQLPKAEQLRRTRRLQRVHYLGYAASRPTQRGDVPRLDYDPNQFVRPRERAKVSRPMSMTAALHRRRDYVGPALFAYGFRPFFLAAGVWAACRHAALDAAIYGRIQAADPIQRTRLAHP